MVQIKRIAFNVVPSGQVVERLHHPFDFPEAALTLNPAQPQIQVVVPGLAGEGLL